MPVCTDSAETRMKLETKSLSIEYEARTLAPIAAVLLVGSGSS